VGTGDTTAITLTPKDGSDPVKLKVEGTGPYTVSAAEGFTPGASYELTLPKGLNFIGTNGEQLPETVRKVLLPVLMVVGLVLATAYLVDGTYNPFLYFRF